MPPALTAETAVAVGEDRKSALLGVVERLVERIGGIRDLLHGLGAGRHDLGPLEQTRHRVIVFLRILRLALRYGKPRIGAIDPELGEIPHRYLDRRPELFLIR